MKNKAFTLIEVLIVVLIIGILAGIALPQYRLAVTKSRYTTAMNLARAIKDSEERYYMLHGQYTTQFDDLDIDCENRAGNYCTTKYGVFSLTYYGRGIVFELYKPTIIYAQFFANASDTYKNKRYCATLNYGQDTDNLANRVCQNLTGQKIPTNTLTERNTYTF